MYFINLHFLRHIRSLSKKICLVMLYVSYTKCVFTWNTCSRRSSCQFKPSPKMPDICNWRCSRPAWNWFCSTCYHPCVQKWHGFYRKNGLAKRTVLYSLFLKFVAELENNNIYQSTYSAPQSLKRSSPAPVVHFALIVIASSREKSS